MIPAGNPNRVNQSKAFRLAPVQTESFFGKKRKFVVVSPGNIAYNGSKEVYPQYSSLAAEQFPDFEQVL